MRELTPQGSKKLEILEGKVPYVYDDAVYPTRQYAKGSRIKGNLTAGVGHLLSKGPDVFPEAVQWIGKSIPEAQIAKWLDEDTDICERAVNGLVKVELPAHRWDVLYRTAFNIGVQAFADSTLLKRVNSSQFSKVPEQLLRWVNTTITEDGVRKKVKSPGLEKRYTQEAAEWAGAAIAPIPATRKNDGATEPVATEIAQPTPQKTTITEWITTGVSGMFGLSGLSGIGGFLGVAIGIVLIGAFLIIAGIIIKRQFFAK